MGIPVVPSVDSDTFLPTPKALNALKAFFSPAARTAGAIAAGSLGNYNSSRQAYNFKPSNTRRLRAGLGRAKAGTGIFKIGMCGDSTSAGYPSDNRKAAPIAMRDFLERRGYGVNGSGPVVANPGGAPGSYLDPRFTMTGTWTTQASNPNGILQTTVVGATIAFSSERVGTTVQFCYLDLGAGFTYSVDGGAAVTVPPSNGTGSLATIAISGLASTTHSIVITVNSVPAGGGFYLAWAEVKADTSGISVGNFGVNSTTTTDWLNGTFYYPQAVLLNWKPDLVFIDLGINDWGSSSTPNSSAADFKARYQQLITAFQNAGADVILCTSNPFEGIDYAPYNKAKYELADSNDVPLIDIYALFESYGIANQYGLYVDSAHPSPAGYAMKGATLAAAIS